MPVSPAEFERRLSRFHTLCQDQGLKLTPQRGEIFHVLAEADDHPDAEALYRRVHERMPSVSPDTIYRTLALLEGRGLIRKVPTGGSTHYDAGVEPHGHFVCGRCHTVFDFHSETIDRLARLPEACACGEVHRVYLQVHGLCHRCQGGPAPPPDRP